MKIMHLLGSLNPSGAEMMLKTASELWKSQGCEGHVVSTGDYPGPFTQELRGAGYTIHHLPFQKTPERWILRYARLLIDERPDIVHVHAERNCLMTMMIPRLMGIRVCRTIHNVFRYQRALGLRKAAARRLLNFIGCRSVSIGYSVYENELNNLGNKTRLLWDWYDEEKFRLPTIEERRNARKCLGVDDETIMIVSVGNGNDVKNYRSIIEAISLLKNDCKTPNGYILAKKPHYFMVGREHPLGIERTLASRLEVNHLVSFCGPQTDVKSYLWAADIYVMPSLYEGLGISAIEAMATGVPTVLADVPGLNDFRKLNLSVEWCSTDSFGILMAIHRVISINREFSRNRGMAHAVKDYFSSGKNALEYLKFWRESHA